MLSPEQEKIISEFLSVRDFDSISWDGITVFAYSGEVTYEAQEFIYGSPTYLDFKKLLAICLDLEPFTYNYLDGYSKKLKKIQRGTKEWTQSVLDLAFSYLIVTQCVHCGGAVNKGYCCGRCGSTDPQGYEK